MILPSPPVNLCEKLPPLGLHNLRIGNACPHGAKCFKAGYLQLHVTRFVFRFIQFNSRKVPLLHSVKQCSPLDVKPISGGDLHYLLSSDLFDGIRITKKKNRILWQVLNQCSPAHIIHALEQPHFSSGREAGLINLFTRNLTLWIEVAE